MFALVLARVPVCPEPCPINIRAVLLVNLRTHMCSGFSLLVYGLDVAKSYFAAIALV